MVPYAEHDDHPIERSLLAFLQENVLEIFINTVIFFKLEMHN